MKKVVKSVFEDFKFVKECLIDNKLLKKKIKINRKNFIETLMEYEGARFLGGEFLGERNISKIPVKMYKLKKNNINGDKPYFFIAYLKRGNAHQVVLTEAWDTFEYGIQRILKSTDRYYIDLNKGGDSNVFKKSKMGRSRF